MNKTKYGKFSSMKAPKTSSLQNTGRSWKPSEQQEAIFKAVDSKNSVVVEAGAGCGKTTTQLEAVKPLANDQKICLLAFNKAIADELASKVPSAIHAKTIHALGLQCCNQNVHKVTVDRNRTKVEDDIQELYPKADFPKLPNESSRAHNGRYYGMVGALRKFVSLTKNYGYRIVDLDSLGLIASTYDIPVQVTEETTQQVNAILDCSFNDTSFVDFDDMIWLPIVHGWKLPKYDLVGVDECVPGWTPVMLADGSSKTIQEIVENKLKVKVRSLDTKTGKEINCRVTAWHKILNQKPLVKIRVLQNHKTGTNRKRNFVVCTVDHKIWTTNRGWVPAGEIRPNDQLVIETAAKTTQKGKVTSEGRKKLSNLQQGNKRGNSSEGGKLSNLKIHRKGNGFSATVPETVLMSALGLGWVWQFPVPTGRKPTCYKIDIANPDKKIAVEVDGHSHDTAKVKAADARKDAFLVSKGWKVFRVKNRDAVQNTAKEVCRILGKDNCPKPATVVEISPIDIPDNYVYDITVEGSHNFYANGVLVHNCQDLNPLRQQFVMNVANRTMCIGDSHQSIYGFCGADTRSMETMRNSLAKRGKVTELPLNITRRCPKSHVAIANSIFPGALEAAPEAPEGTVGKSHLGNLTNSLQAQDFVLCRTNAPLVWLALQLVKAKRPVVILGRDFCEGLKYIIRQSGGETQSEWVGNLRNWYGEQMTKFEGDSPKQVRMRETISDKYYSIISVAGECPSANSAIAQLDELFGERTFPSAVVLSSIHKAKGLEAERVFITHPHLLPHPMAKSEWEVLQETNLAYVAATRSKSHLEYVEGDFRELGKGK